MQRQFYRAEEGERRERKEEERKEERSRGRQRETVELYLVCNISRLSTFPLDPFLLPLPATVYSYRR
jgi:hypothetical protein